MVEPARHSRGALKIVGRGGRLREVVVVMAKLGTIAFGGPAVHVSMLRDEAVRKRAWLDDEEFLDLFGAVSVLPGPSSTQLAILLSRRRAGWKGLVLGGMCFIAPAMTIVMALAWLYVRYGATPTGSGLLHVVEPVIVAVVVVALWGLGRSALKRPWFVAIGAGALAAYFLRINVLIPLLVGGLVVAMIDNRRRLPSFPAFVASVPLFAAMSARSRPGSLAVLGESAKLGVVVFGSGYVLLAFMRADLVAGMHWLTLRQLLDAVAAGQVTPGPVFTTATFVGYLIGGVPLALVATAGIFVPSFVMVAALEPFMRALRRSQWLAPALQGITVAAVGLMAGVTFDLARSTITDVLTFALAAAAFSALLWNRARRSQLR